MHEDVQLELTDADLTAALRVDAARGLTDTPKWLPSKWFYDSRGSELFERITELPEYYPTRTERVLLQRVAGEIARAVREVQVLVELGSGSSDKTRLLLSALSAEASLKMYVPQDVSATALAGAAPLVAAEFPGLAVRPLVSDFTDTLHNLPSGGRRMVAFLGSTIGNLTPPERAEFLDGIHNALEPGEWLLLGATLVADPQVLIPAYDDAAGVTAEFNRNMLRVLNDRLGANFDPDRFDHIAVWDPDNEWIEMRLQSRDNVLIQIADLQMEVSFRAGEQLRTEISGKFRVDGLIAELVTAGFAVARYWTDPDKLFAVMLANRST